MPAGHWASWLKSERRMLVPCRMAAAAQMVAASCGSSIARQPRSLYSIVARVNVPSSRPATAPHTRMRPVSDPTIAGPRRQ